MRLFFKFLLAFLAVVVVGMLTVAVLVNQATTREVQGIMFGNRMLTAVGLTQELAGYYRGHGTWEGVAAVVRSPHHGMMPMPQPQLLVADAAGLVVADTENARLGQTLTTTELVEGYAIEVEGVRVGTLVAQGSGPMGGPPLERELLFRTNRAVWLAALIAGVAALVSGGLIAYSLARPIQQLTRAVHAVARGDLSQQVVVQSHDEIGELASAFNTMTRDLQHAERLRRDMTADIAHELRNPLTVLQGNLEAVLDGVLPPTEDNLRPLLEQTHLLTRLVDDLRTLALADAGQLSLNRVPTDPATLTRSVVARFAPQAEAKTIALHLEVADALPNVALDPQRIEQVLGNLLSNALRHTPEHGVITVTLATGGTLSAPSPHLLMTVADTGSGIAPEALPHLFERFYRVDKARARAEGGTGLGLTIARQLVEAHAGRIWAESDFGHGTRVTFTLPLQNN